MAQLYSYALKCSAAHEHDEMLANAMVAADADVQPIMSSMARRARWLRPAWVRSRGPEMSGDCSSTR